MAESILFGITESLLKNLGSRALDEIASAWGFKTRLDKLKKRVNSINDVLLDAEEKQVGRPNSHAVQGWLGRLKTVVYAADDLFDEFATVASQREVSHTFPMAVLVFFSTSNQISFAFNISKKIKKIREELDDIFEDSSKYSFVKLPREVGGFSRHVRDQTDSFVDGSNVIGRDDDKKVIIDIMLASSSAREQPLSVICIVGIGGMGKTTLAQLIYNDEMVKKHFELKFWVCVSETFDKKEIIKKILMSATNTQCQNLEMDQLQGQLRKEIGGRKYLLVLDDVWNVERLEWDDLSALLKVAGGEGSKILVTTRSRKVADNMGTVPGLPAYDLKGLSDEKSWALFEKMAFEPGESENKPHLVKLGKEIVKKCAALPLALRTLGSLVHGNGEEKWVLIAGTSFAELPDTQKIMGILKLSYNHLFSTLKKCFAYCALFPKDYEFEKEMLVDLWMAEGFIIPAIETQSLNERGDEYIMLLLQRCFFQDITRDKWGNISSFKMHDLMHDLALEIAGTESKVAKFQDVKFSDKIRHVSFDNQLTNMQDIPSCLLKAKQLRTFLLPEQYYIDAEINMTDLEQLISNLRCLRVLDLRGLGLRSLPKSIGKLIHLRYLRLSRNLIEELPASITRLQNLQTLILYQCEKLRALPIHTRKLTNLRNLNISYCSLTHMPPGLGELTSLHNLPLFKVKCQPATANLRDLKTLNNLRGALKIELVHSEDPASEVLSSKHGLTGLVLSFETDLCVHASGSNHDEALLEGLKPHPNLKELKIYYYRGQQFPSWAMEESLCMTLPNLVEIFLFHCGQCREVPSFSQLAFLRRLSLINLESVEYLEKSLHGILPQPTETFFPSLQELTLENMDNLKGWWEETEAIDRSEQDEVLHQSSQRHLRPLSFSILTILQIEDCTSLTYFPLIPNVEELALYNVNRNLTVLKKLTSSAVSGNAESSVTSCKYMSKLKTLRVDEVEDLISMPEENLGQITSLKIEDSKLLNTGTLEEVFKRLSSLSCLEFIHCKSLTSVSEGMEHLTSLESLNMCGCDELDLSQNEQLKDGMPWNNLRSLTLNGMPKLVHLPSGLQHLTKLRTLRLKYNDNLVELPQWISCLSSLESIEFYECPQLTCLPEEFGKLTTLNSLLILNCPGLTERCRGPTGSDWPKIQHIVDIQIV